MTTLLDQDKYFEVEKAKEKLDISLPIQIGYFILQYAKLRMPQFYYDYMDVFVDRADFAYFEMDTDSAYMALPGTTFASVVKPDIPTHTDRMLPGRRRSGMVSAHLLHNACQIRQEDTRII